MVEGFGARSIERSNRRKLVLSVILLVIAVYELFGVIYVRFSQRPFKLKYTKLLQSLVSLFLVVYLAVTVKVLRSFSRDEMSCWLLWDIMWFSYIVLSITIHIFYWMKQQVLFTAIDMRNICWWLRPLQVLCILLIILAPCIGVLPSFETSKSYVWQNNICIICASAGLTFFWIYTSLDISCVVLLLILFVLPLWRVMRENNESKVLRRVLIRNLVLCSLAVFTTIVAWMTLTLLYHSCENETSLDFGTYSFVFAVEQFVICNCILRTMTDWQQYLSWPCGLASKISSTFNRSSPYMKEQTELLCSPANDTILNRICR